PSLTRKATPNNDSTTPTLTGTLPVVNQRHVFVRSASNGDGSLLANAVLRGGGGADSRAAGSGSRAADAGCGAGPVRAGSRGAGAGRCTGLSTAGGGSSSRARCGGGVSVALRASATLRASSRFSSWRTRAARSATQPATAPTMRPNANPSKPLNSTPPMTPPSNARMTTTMSGLLTSTRPLRAQSFGTDGRIENGEQLRGLPAPAEICEVIAGV